MKKPIKKAVFALAIIFVLIWACIYFFNIRPASRLPSIEDMISSDYLQGMVDSNIALNLSFLLMTKKIYYGPEKIQGFAASPIHRNKKATIILEKDGVVLDQKEYVLDMSGLFLFDLPNFGEGTYFTRLEIEGKRLTQNYFMVTEPMHHRFSAEILNVYWYDDLLNVWGIVRSSGTPFQGNIKIEILCPDINWEWTYLRLDIPSFKIIDTVHNQTVDGNFNLSLIPNAYYLSAYYASAFPSLFLRTWYNEKENSLAPIFRPKGRLTLSQMGETYLASLESRPQAEEIHGLAIKKVQEMGASPWKSDFPAGNKIRIQAVTPLKKAIMHVLDPVTLNLKKTIVENPKTLRIAPSYPLSFVDIYARSKTHEYFDYAILLKKEKVLAKMELRSEFKAGSDLEVRMDSKKSSKGILIVSRADIERDNLEDLLGDRIINQPFILSDSDEKMLQGFSSQLPLYPQPWPYAFRNFRPPPPPPPPHHRFPRFWVDKKKAVRPLPKAVESKETPGIIFFDSFPINNSAKKFIKMPAEPGNWKAELIVYYQNEHRFDRIERRFKTSDQR